MIQNLFNDMTELLRKQAPDFFVNEKLNKNKVTDAAYSYDVNLLKALLTNESLKKQFQVRPLPPQAAGVHIRMLFREFSQERIPQLLR